VTNEDESLSNDEEEGYDWSEPREICVSPVEPRFTDYYFFVTASKTEEQRQEYEVETGIASMDEKRSD